DCVGLVTAAQGESQRDWIAARLPTATDKKPGSKPSASRPLFDAPAPRKPRRLWWVAGIAAASVAVAGLVWALTSPEPEQKPAPATFIDNPAPKADELGLRANMWHNVLDTEPTPLVWNGFNHRFIYDKGLRELHLEVPNESLWSFGQTERTGYR